MRRKLAYASASQAVTAGKAAAAVLDPLRRDMESARKLCDVAESLGRRNQESALLAQEDWELERRLAYIPSTMVGLVERFDGAAAFTEADLGKWSAPSASISVSPCRSARAAMGPSTAPWASTIADASTSPSARRNPKACGRAATSPKNTLPSLRFAVPCPEKPPEPTSTLVRPAPTWLVSGLRARGRFRIAPARQSVPALPVYPGRMKNSDHVGFVEGLGQQVERARIEKSAIAIVGHLRRHDHTGGAQLGCLDSSRHPVARRGRRARNPLFRNAASVDATVGSAAAPICNSDIRSGWIPGRPAPVPHDRFRPG